MPTTRRRRTYGRRPKLRFEALEPYEQAFVEDRMTRELSREGSFGAFCLERGPMNSNPKHVRDRIVALWHMRDARRAEQGLPPAKRRDGWYEPERQETESDGADGSPSRY